MLVIAHRGASGDFPENTLAAFVAAAEASADMCEFDVRMTRDGALVVIHDETVDRTSDGRGEVGAMDLGEIKRLDAGIWFSARFEGQRIPTLAEVAATVRGRCGLVVELKNPSIEFEALEVLRRQGVVKDTIILSFDRPQISRLSALKEAPRTGLLVDRERDGIVEAALAAGASAVCLQFRVASPALCAKARRSGLAVFVWTVDDEDLMRHFIAAEIDGIMTNYPGRLSRLLG